MRNIFLCILCCLGSHKLLPAQNNPIFYGGPGDGWTSLDYNQSTNMTPFRGGDGDGWNVMNYIQPTDMTTFHGGQGDGWISLNYIQPTIMTTFHGGDGDGWNSLNYVQTTDMTTFHGGDGDGWNFSNYAQSHNEFVYFGGQGDGWANTYSPVGPLPVSLLSFIAEKKSNEVLLTWETSMEMNSAYYVVEKSRDAIQFIEIGIVNSMNDPNGAKYELTDQQPYTGYNYYRIKMVDLDQTFKYSPTRHVIFDGYTSVDAIKVFPNPSSGILNIEIPIVRTIEPMVINITNSFGQVLKQEKSNSGIRYFQYNLSAYAKGTYYIQVKTDSFEKIEKIILQ